MRQIYIGFVTLWIIYLGVQFAVPASAQAVSFGGETPIDVKADRATYKGSTTILIGNVRVKQDQATIYADRMDLYRPEKETTSSGFMKLGNINRIVATGNFRYITSENRVTGQKGVYERDKEIITVTGNVKFTQNNGNTIAGEKIVYDLTTNRTKVGGICDGRDCQKSDRVALSIGGDKKDQTPKKQDEE